MTRFARELLLPIVAHRFVELVIVIEPHHPEAAGQRRFLMKVRQDVVRVAVPDTHGRAGCVEDWVLIADVGAFDGNHVVHAKKLVRKGEVRKPDRPASPGSRKEIGKPGDCRTDRLRRMIGISSKMTEPGAGIGGGPWQSRVRTSSEGRSLPRESSIVLTCRVARVRSAPRMNNLAAS